MSFPLHDIDQAFYAWWVSEHGHPPTFEQVSEFQEAFHRWRVQHLSFRGRVRDDGSFEGGCPQLPGVEGRAETLVDLAELLAGLAEQKYRIPVEARAIAEALEAQGRELGWAPPVRDHN